MGYTNWVFLCLWDDHVLTNLLMLNICYQIAEKGNEFGASDYISSFVILKPRDSMYLIVPIAEFLS